MSLAHLDEWLDRSAENSFQENLAPLKSALENTVGAYEKFLLVSRRSNPVIPVCVDGPIDGLVDRLLCTWDSLQPSGPLAVDNRAALTGMGMYLQYIFSESGLGLVQSEEEEAVFGIRFYERPVPEFPTAIRFSKKHTALLDARCEAYTTLVEIGYLLAWASLATHLTTIPPAAFKPFQTSPKHPAKLMIHTPFRRSTAELAQFAFFYKEMYACNEYGIPSFHPPMHRCARDVATDDRKGALLRTAELALLEPPGASDDADPDSKNDTALFSQEWFYVLSGVKKAEGHHPQKASLAFLASRILEFRRIGRIGNTVCSLDLLSSAHLLIYATFKTSADAVFRENYAFRIHSRAFIMTLISPFVLFLQSQFTDNQCLGHSSVLNVSAIC
jgi:hypothetical protein